MRTLMLPVSDDHHTEAMAELRAELAGFSQDGLTSLHEDLDRGVVMRGSWSGCVISYKAGAAGSCRRDRLGRARNAFTVLWDNGWLSEDDVVAAVLDELVLREATMTRRRTPTPVP